MDAYTVSTLAECQLLPDGLKLVDILPEELYHRLRRHLEYVRLVLPKWITSDQKSRGLYSEYLYNAITGNWQRKRPVWAMLMVNSLNEIDIKSRGIPVLDLYLAQEAQRLNKRIGSIEKVEYRQRRATVAESQYSSDKTSSAVHCCPLLSIAVKQCNGCKLPQVEEQCIPLNGLESSQVVFALNQTLRQHEDIRRGRWRQRITTDDLIRHYNCGDLNEMILNYDNSRVSR